MLMVYSHQCVVKLGMIYIVLAPLDVIISQTFSDCILYVLQQMRLYISACAYIKHLITYIYNDVYMSSYMIPLYLTKRGISMYSTLW